MEAPGATGGGGHTSGAGGVTGGTGGPATGGQGGIDSLGAAGVVSGDRRNGDRRRTQEPVDRTANVLAAPTLLLFICVGESR